MTIKKVPMSKIYNGRIGRLEKDLKFILLVERQRGYFKYIFLGTESKYWIHEFRDMSEKLSQLAAIKKITIKTAAIEYNYAYNTNIRKEDIFKLIGYCMVNKKIVISKFIGESNKERILIPSFIQDKQRFDKYALKVEQKKVSENRHRKSSKNYWRRTHKKIKPEKLINILKKDDEK